MSTGNKLNGQKLRMLDLKSGNWTDLDPLQVELALEVMMENGDSVAYFGINGYFLFSDKEEMTGMIH